MCISIAVLPGIQICSKIFSATGDDRQPAALHPAVLLGHGMWEVTVLTSAVFDETMFASYDGVVRRAFP